MQHLDPFRHIRTAAGVIDNDVVVRLARYNSRSRINYRWSDILFWETLFLPLEEEKREITIQNGEKVRLAVRVIFAATIGSSAHSAGSPLDSFVLVVVFFFVRLLLSTEILPLDVLRCHPTHFCRLCTFFYALLKKKKKTLLLLY